MATRCFKMSSSTQDFLAVTITNLLTLALPYPYKNTSYCDGNAAQVFI